MDLFLDFFFFKIFFIHERHREADTRQREKHASWREPDGGLDPSTPGSQPEPKADAQPLSHPSIPRREILKGLREVQR